MDPYIGMGNRGGNRWSGGIGTGIGRGLEKMTGTMLSVLMKKKELEDAEERNKAYTKFLKAKTDLAHISLRDEANKIKQNEKFFNMMESGQLSAEDMGYSYNTGTGAMTIKSKEPTEEQQYKQKKRQADTGLAVNSLRGIIEQIKTKGTLKTKTGDIRYTPELANRILPSLAESFKKAGLEFDTADPEVQAVLQELQQVQPAKSWVGKLLD